MNDLNNTTPVAHKNTQLPYKLITGRITHQICTTFGWVTDLRYENTNHVSVNTHRNYSNGDSYVSGVSVSNHAQRTAHFFLQKEDGSMRNFSLGDWSCALGNEHPVTILWAIPEQKEKGPFLAIKNHTTNEIGWNHAALEKLSFQEGGSLFTNLYLLGKFPTLVITFFLIIVLAGMGLSIIAFALPFLSIYLIYWTIKVNRSRKFMIDRYKQEISQYL